MRSITAEVAPEPASAVLLVLGVIQVLKVSLTGAAKYVAGAWR
jgi:hypothetical protein